MEIDGARERVIKFLANASGRAPESIRDDERLAGFAIDSLEDVEFVMELEDEFGVEIPDPVSPIVTVADLVTWVRSACRSDRS